MATARRATGLTLVELLVALAVAALLASIAYPSYRAHLLRARRTEAIEALLATAAAQERFMLNHGRYAEDFAVGTGGLEPGLPMEPETRGGRYRLALAVSGDGGFRAMARPLPGRGQDQDEACAEFHIAADGARWARAADGRDSTRECWG